MLRIFVYGYEKFFLKLCLLLVFTGASLSFGAALAKTQDNAVELGKTDKMEVNYSGRVTKLKGSLFIDNVEEAQITINKQQAADMQDIENLWNATVNNNAIIKFSLKKLAIPEEQRRIHSSLMAKSMSALISGASMLPSFMGMNYAVQSASFAGARLANNYINKDTNKKLNENPLTDTEMIELATLIEDLQNEIVTSYYNYKGSLNRLKDCRAQLLLYNKNYSKALKDNDALEIAVSSALWEDGLIEEYTIAQDVKKYQLMLQRLAGKEAIDGLNLAKYDLSIQNIEKNDLNLKKRQINVQ